MSKPFQSAARSLGKQKEVYYDEVPSYPSFESRSLRRQRLAARRAATLGEPVELKKEDTNEVMEIAMEKAQKEDTASLTADELVSIVHEASQIKKQRSSPRRMSKKELDWSLGQEGINYVSDEEHYHDVDLNSHGNEEFFDTYDADEDPSAADDSFWSAASPAIEGYLPRTPDRVTTHKKRRSDLSAPDTEATSGSSDDEWENSGFEYETDEDELCVDSSGVNEEYTEEETGVEHTLEDLTSFVARTNEIEFQAHLKKFLEMENQATLASLADMEKQIEESKQPTFEMKQHIVELGKDEEGDDWTLESVTGDSTIDGSEASSVASTDDIATFEELAGSVFDLITMDERNAVFSLFSNNETDIMDRNSDDETDSTSIDRDSEDEGEPPGWDEETDITEFDRNSDDETDITEFDRNSDDETDITELDRNLDDETDITEFDRNSDDETELTEFDRNSDDETELTGFDRNSDDETELTEFDRNSDDDDDDKPETPFDRMFGAFERGVRSFSSNETTQSSKRVHFNEECVVHELSDDDLDDEELDDDDEYDDSDNDEDGDDCSERSEVDDQDDDNTVDDEDYQVDNEDVLNATVKEYGSTKETVKRHATNEILATFVHSHFETQDKEGYVYPSTFAEDEVEEPVTKVAEDENSASAVIDYDEEEEPLDSTNTEAVNVKETKVSSERSNSTSIVLDDIIQCYGAKSRVSIIQCYDSKSRVRKEGALLQSMEDKAIKLNENATNAYGTSEARPQKPNLAAAEPSEDKLLVQSPRRVRGLRDSLHRNTQNTWRQDHPMTQIFSTRNSRGLWEGRPTTPNRSTKHERRLVDKRESPHNALPRLTKTKLDAGESKVFGNEVVADSLLSPDTMWEDFGSSPFYETAASPFHESLRPEIWPAEVEARRGYC